MYHFEHQSIHKNSYIIFWHIFIKLIYLVTRHGLILDVTVVNSSLGKSQLTKKLNYIFHYQIVLGLPDMVGGDDSAGGSRCGGGGSGTPYQVRQGRLTGAVNWLQLPVPHWLLVWGKGTGPVLPRVGVQPIAAATHLPASTR